MLVYTSTTIFFYFCIKRVFKSFQVMTIYGELHHHPSHPEHKLELRHEERPYWCDGCHQIGFGSCYKCAEPFSGCDFHLHKDCACPKDTITHPFFADCVFHFLVSPDDPGSSYCAACGLDIWGYNYHCFDKELDLHPSCATLPDRMGEGEEVRLKLSKKLTKKCYKCGERKLRNERKCWSYVSECGECHLHVNCVKDMLIESWETEWLGRREEEKGDGDDEKAVAKREPKLRIVIEKAKGSGSWGKFGKYKKIVKIALTFIMAAVVGDPTALVIGLISSMLTH